MISALLLAGVALGSPDDGPRLTVGGDLKTFTVATFPYDHVLVGEDPSSTGIVDGRIKVTAQLPVGLHLEAHHAATATTGGSASTSWSTGVGGSAPQVVDLSWEAEDSDSWALSGRTDRLRLRYRQGPVDVSVGRQPITLGAGLVFTPMDLVNPFHPATIDTEYKPGVDAVRIDGFSGMSSGTLVGAYSGSWDAEGTVLALAGQSTVGLFDIGGMLGAIRGDAVGGVTTRGGIGPVAVHGDVTLTLPAERHDEDPFVRAVTGAMLTDGTRSLTAELYLQTLGATDPDDYLEQASGERYLQGELWAMGTAYAALMGAYDLGGLWSASMMSLVNLTDISALVAPSLSVSVGDNAVASAGAFLGLGERPPDPTTEQLLAGEIPVESEFGLIPHTAFIRLSDYF
ncbi:MAG: hypothetical protein QGG40_03775 [Myxococcota bacterium]|nr:hypothetical protein [Myxococcota bacterium]